MAAFRSILKVSNFLKNGCSQQQLLLYTSFSIRGRFKSTYETKEYTTDPADKFLNSEVQAALKTLTRVDYTRVFKKRKLGDRQLEIPRYQFMTTEELQEATNTAHKKAEELLQMPPVVQIREPINKVLSTEPALQGFDPDNSRFVFTDITFGARNHSRLIIARDPCGTLQYADWATRDRMNQIYFPTPGREIHVPLVFSDEYLYPLLERGEYEYVLDRACAQFEPDSEAYQRATSITWQHADASYTFEKIRSTRHFGPFVFFLSWFESVDNLLLELIETSYISDANVLMTLNSIIHDLPYKASKDAEPHSTTIIERYIEEKSTKRAPLQLAMKAFKELEAQKNELESGIKAAHGR